MERTLNNGNKRNILKMFDLRKLGDVVYHYACKVQRLVINGRLLYSSTPGERESLGWPSEETIIPDSQDLYAVFDTGTTGAMIQDEIFFDGRFPQPPRSMQVSFNTINNKEFTVSTEAR